MKIDTSGSGMDNASITTQAISEDNEKNEEATDLFPCIYVTYGEIYQKNCSTVKGGHKLLRANGEQFSAGYWASYNNGGGYCLVTCGHPFYNASSALDVYLNTTNDKFGVVNTNNTYIGTYIDASLVTRYSSTATPVQSSLSNNITVSGTRSQLPSNGYVSVCFRGSTYDNIQIGTETMNYTNDRSGTKMSLYFIDYDFGDNGESGAPVYYKYGTNYYLFGIIVGRKNGGTVVCRASTINNFFGISAYTG